MPYCWDRDSSAHPGFAIYRYIFSLFGGGERDNLFIVLLCVIIYLFFLLKPSKINFNFYLTVFWARWRYNQAKEHTRTFMELCNIWGYIKFFIFQFCLRLSCYYSYWFCHSHILMIYYTAFGN